MSYASLNWVKDPRGRDMAYDPKTKTLYTIFGHGECLANDAWIGSNGREAAEWQSYIAEVKAIAGKSFCEYSAHYSFLAAFEAGMSPDIAVADCVAWLET